MSRLMKLIKHWVFLNKDIFNCESRKERMKNVKELSESILNRLDFGIEIEGVGRCLFISIAEISRSCHQDEDEYLREMNEIAEICKFSNYKSNLTVEDLMKLI